MNCDQAVRIITSAEPTDERQISAALAYIKQHPGCLARVDQLTRALLSDLERELPCAEARTQFFAYHELTTQQLDVTKEFLDLHSHLQRCPYCQFDYGIMQESILAYEQDHSPAAQPTASFARAFLPPLPAPALWGIREQIRTFVEEIPILIAQSAARFGALSAALTPALATAVPLRAAGSTASYAALLLPDPEANVRFQLETATVDPGSARVILQVFEANANRPVAGARVTLRTAQRELLTSQLTESDGRASFPSLTEGKYLFQIRYQDKTWELSVAIAQQA